ncbi:LamG-like jellyroll fold domain-containing protein [Lacinutrix cladophorae]
MIKKITFFVLLSLIYFVHSSHTLASLNNNYFFTTPITADQVSDYLYEDTIFTDIQYIANGTVIDDISYDGWRFNSYQSESGVYPAGEALTNDANSGVRLYTDDSSNFKFYSIDYLIDLRTISSVSITFYGFRDGVQVESQVFTVPDDEIGTFTFNWPAVDEIRVASPSMYIFFDNFSIGAAGPILTPATHLNFDGNNDFVSKSNESIFNFTAGTVEAWIKPTANSNNKAVVSMRDIANASGTRWSLHVNEGNNTIGIYNGISYIDIVVSAGISANVWSHVVWVMSTSQTIVYFNGTLVGTIPVGINVAPTNMPLTIGAADTNNYYPAEYFSGDIDEVRVWNVQRSVGEITGSKDCELLGSEAGLVTYYNFNQGFGTGDNTTIDTLNDETMNANNGALTNFALTGTNSNWSAGSTIATGNNCNTLGTEMYNLDYQVAIYPNPTSGVINIKLTSLNDVSLEVFDIKGSIVLSKNIESEVSQLELSKLQTGLYIFKLKSQEGQINKRVIIE